MQPAVSPSRILEKSFFRRLANQIYGRRVDGWSLNIHTRVTCGSVDVLVSGVACIPATGCPKIRNVLIEKY